MVSKRPQATKFGELNVSYGTYDTKLMSLDSTGPLDKEGQWLYRVLALAARAVHRYIMPRVSCALFKPMLTWVPTARTNVTVFAEYQRDYNNTVQGYLPNGERCSTVRPENSLPGCSSVNLTGTVPAVFANAPAGK